MSTAETSQRRERKDVRRNLERVLQAAGELFAERGADVKMEEVAARAGVGVGTIYRRFPSKEHLFAAVSHAACAHTRLCLHEAAASHADPVGKLRALVLVQYQRAAQQAPLLDLRPDGVEHLHEQQHLYAALHEMLQQVISDGQRQGVLRPGDPRVLATLCLELLNPRTFMHMQQVLGGSAEDVADHVIAFVLHGLGAE